MSVKAQEFLAFAKTLPYEEMLEVYNFLKAHLDRVEEAEKNDKRTVRD